MKVTPKKNIYKNVKGKGKVKRFTKGKIYTDISTDIKKTLLLPQGYKSKFYEIVNDLGDKEIIYETSLFQTISQKRNKILKELLNK